jgi:hypothetical protein
MMAMEKAICAYCGEWTQTQEEHVIPRCFAPEELHGSCKWVIVRACGRCNQGFSADESDFREFSVVTNAPGDTLVKDALFRGPVSDNWRRADGRGRAALERLLGRIRKPDGSGLSTLNELVEVPNLRIAPDASMLRVVRKIIRGLYYHHFTAKRGLPQVLPESQIWINPVFDPAPLFMDLMHEFEDWHVIHPAVFGYAVAECDEVGLPLPGVDSIWRLVASKGAVFDAAVLSNTFPLVGDAEKIRWLLREMAAGVCSNTAWRSA